MVLRKIMLSVLRILFRLLVSKAAGKGVLEVERKFAITAEEAEGLPFRLRELGFTPSGTVTMADTFLPAREAGEMLRVRDEMSGDVHRTVFTHKVWIRTTDGGKERQEREGEVNPLVRTLFIVFGRMAAGGRLRGFSKDRALFEGKGGDQGVVVSIDKVSGLGKYSGNYLEVETLVPVGKDTTAARERIFEIVGRVLGSRRDDVQQSYMEMLELSLK